MAKSKKSRPAPAPRPRIVVGVPGAWRDGAQVQELLATRHRLLFAGEASVLVNLDDPDAPDPLVLETYPRDPTLRRAFERSSGGAIEEALLARIEAHTLTLYLVDEEGGALDSAARPAQRAGARTALAARAREQRRRRVQIALPESG